VKTSLPADTLVVLHAEGYAHTGPFVNPSTIVKSKRILRERGEEWAQSVLLRAFDRRSVALPAFPWLNAGEEEILVLADSAERQR